MGQAALTAADPQQERVLRALLNGTYHRRQEVETLNAQLAQREEQIARLESTQSAAQKWETSPEYKSALDRYNTLRGLEESGDLPPGTALEFWNGAELKRRELADTEFKDRMKVVETERAERAATEFAAAAWNEAITKIPPIIKDLPDFPKWFRQSLESFDKEFELGHFPQIRTPEDLKVEFSKFFGRRLIAEPAALKEFQRIRASEDKGKKDAAAKAAAALLEKDAIKKQAVDEFKKTAADKRAAAPPHPLGRLAAASRDRPPEAETPGDEIPAGQSAHQFRRAAREKAREAARARLRGA